MEKDSDSVEEVAKALLPTLSKKKKPSKKNMLNIKWSRPKKNFDKLLLKATSKKDNKPVFMLFIQAIYSRSFF